MTEAGESFNETQRKPARGALIMAIRRRDFEQAKDMVRRGSDVNEKDEWGTSALAWAATEGAEELVRLLLDNNADIDVKNNYDMTVMDNLRNLNYPIILQLMLDTREIRRRAAGACVMTDQDKAANSAAPEYGALLSAVTRNNVLEAIDLVQRGAGLNERDNFGNTPLIYAASRNFADMVEMLIKAGAEVNAANNFGRTPLMMTASAGSADTARLLIDHGADVNQKDSDGTPPLLWAVRRKHSEIVSLLIEKGARLDEANNKGTTALLWAAGNGLEEIVQSLLHQGAAFDKRNNDGEAALDLARNNRFTAIVRILDAEQAKIHHATAAGKQERLKIMTRQKSKRGVLP